MSYLTIGDSKKPSFVDRFRSSQYFRYQCYEAVVLALAVAALATATVFSFKFYMQEGFPARKTLCRFFIANGMVGGTCSTAIATLFTTAAIVRVCQYDTTAPLKNCQPYNGRPTMFLPSP